MFPTSLAIVAAIIVGALTGIHWSQWLGPPWLSAGFAVLATATLVYGEVCFLRKTRTKGLLGQLICAVLSAVCVGVATHLGCLGDPGHLQRHMLAAALLGLLVPTAPFAVLLFSGALDALRHNSSIKSLEVGFLGAKLSIDLNARQHEALWHIYTELVSRIATVPLHDPFREDKEQVYVSGNLKAALTSLYNIFEIVRGELKNMPPSPKPKADYKNTDEEDVQGVTLEIYALNILNNLIRPFLTRWHPRLDEWNASTGMPEHLWPLNALCRKDLETMRRAVHLVTWQLGEALEVAHQEKLLHKKPAKTIGKLELEPIETLNALEEHIRPLLCNNRMKSGWSVFVECAALARRKDPLDDGKPTVMVRELRRLTRVIRVSLKKMQPTPVTAARKPAITYQPTNNTDPTKNTVEGIALTILQLLTQFVDRWEGNEANDEALFEEELTYLYDALTKQTTNLGNHLGVRDTENLVTKN